MTTNRNELIEGKEYVITIESFERIPLSGTKIKFIKCVDNTLFCSLQKNDVWEDGSTEIKEDEIFFDSKEEWEKYSEKKLKEFMEEAPEEARMAFIYGIMNDKL